MRIVSPRLPRSDDRLPTLTEEWRPPRSPRSGGPLAHRGVTTVSPRSPRSGGPLAHRGVTAPSLSRHRDPPTRSDRGHGESRAMNREIGSHGVSRGRDPTLVFSNRRTSSFEATLRTRRAQAESSIRTDGGSSGVPSMESRGSPSWPSSPVARGARTSGSTRAGRPPRRRTPPARR